MKKIRILIAKVGLDGHDRGAKVIATGLRDAGMEIIYTGIRQSAEAVVSIAVQEDVDGIGVSTLSGAHMTVIPKIMNLLKQKDIKDILIFGGGIIPKNDISTLKAMGVDRIFLPGTKVEDVAQYLKQAISSRQG